MLKKTPAHLTQGNSLIVLPNGIQHAVGDARARSTRTFLSLVNLSSSEFPVIEMQVLFALNQM